jgi:hypothetical protein
VQSETVLPMVVYGATTVYVVAGVLSMFSRRNLYDQIGQGGLSAVREDRLRGDELLERPLEQAADRAEREREIRQMLQARSARLVGRGQAPLDVEAELARLEQLDARRSSAGDAALVEEIRQLMIGRNERRLRQGLHVLDVDREIERTLTELDS